jgi:hypothetical protein
MTRFLVYVETQYYPWAEFVDAPSAEEAPNYVTIDASDADAFAVMPVESVTLIGDPTYIDGYKEQQQ